MIYYDRDFKRLWIAGKRIHHGLTGLAFATIGLILMAHDWRDRTLWMRCR